jgi:short-subunit dehydrogenase
MFVYKGSTALITGASKGLGTAFAKTLAARGANVILVARTTEKLEALADSLASQYGVKCIALSIDLTAPDAVQLIERELDTRGLVVDLLVNNAGLGHSGPFLSHDMKAEQASVQLNVQALVGLSHALGTRMATVKRGGIINIASNASFQPLPYMAVYAATKAFVLSFSEALGYELASDGVQVMAACPGPTATSFFEGTKTGMKDKDFDTAESVVERTLAAFDKGKAVTHPGRFSVRVATWLPRFFPRNVVVRFAAAATRGMGLTKAVVPVEASPREGARHA